MRLLTHWQKLQALDRLRVAIRTLQNLQSSVVLTLGSVLCAQVPVRNDSYYRWPVILECCSHSYRERKVRKDVEDEQDFSIVSG